MPRTQKYFVACLASLLKYEKAEEKVPRESRIRSVFILFLEKLVRQRPLVDLDSLESSCVREKKLTVSQFTRCSRRAGRARARTTAPISGEGSSEPEASALEFSCRRWRR